MEWLLNLNAAAVAIKGDIKNCDGDELIHSVSTDTRTITDVAVFVALKGERFDGHRFVAAAVESGAVSVSYTHLALSRR